MDATTKPDSAPDRFQCIVCHMTTATLPRLHRHQTYQHTSEELSLMTIGHSVSHTNTAQDNIRIVYDNCWLRDPTKQAKFYTVSARLLHDCDDNANCCMPVDYTVVRDTMLRKMEEDGKIVETGSELLANNCDDNANCLPIDSIFPELNGNGWPEDSIIKDLGMREANLMNEDLEEDFLGFPELNMISEEGGFVQVEAGPPQGSLIPEEIEVEEPAVGDEKANQFVDCVDRLCCDLKKMKRKLPKAKKDPFKVPVPRKAKGRGKYPKIPRLEAKIDSAPNDKTEMVMQTIEEAGISAANESPGANCIQRVSESEKIRNPVDSAMENIVEGRSEEIEAENRIDAASYVQRIFESEKTANPAGSAMENIVEGRSEENETENRIDAASCVQRVFESEKMANPADSAMENIVEGRSHENKTEDRIGEREDEQNLTNGNFVGHPLETVGTETVVTQDSADANSAEIKLENSEGDISAEMDFASVDRSANSDDDVPMEIPADYTIPYYPPDMNDCSILILDPEIRRLVWSSFEVVDGPNELEAPSSPRVLTELTTVNFRGGEINESSGSQVDNGSGSYSPEDRRRPRTNFVLRPRKVKTRRSKRHQK